MNKIGGMNYKNKKYTDMYCPDCKKVGTFTEWLDQPGGYLEGVICDNCGSNRQQKEPPYYQCHCYKETCTCGKQHVLMTQEDRGPEYYTQVGLICECGKVVEFNLPVN